MRRSGLPVQSFRLQNFKAVRDSGVVKFTPLTVFIGNNGSGKSSLIEGLETFQSIVADGLDEAMQRWSGFEHIWNKAGGHKSQQKADERSYQTNPMRFDLRGTSQMNSYYAMSEVNANAGMDAIFIHREQFESGSRFNRVRIRRDTNGWADTGYVGDSPDEVIVKQHLSDGESILTERVSIRDWQFLELSPQSMGMPVPQKRTGGRVMLAKNGSNIAEFLLDILKTAPNVLDGIIETLKYVLPYARNVEPLITSELQRTVYLQLREGDFALPGWLLSTGTLRILALLAVLRHPNPPPLLVVEEIENGLDPRTISLVVEEIRSAVESGSTQVILTTHSPYLLDLLTLSHIVVVERGEDGSPTFTRPADDAALQEWTKKFTPGQLYTMSKLSGRK